MKFRPSRTPRRTLKREIAAIISSLADVDFGPLRKRYSGMFYAKYFDLERWVPYNVRIIRELSLFDAKPITALDIACGGGLLLYCLGYYGHRAVGIDCAEPLFADMAKALGVERRVSRVEPMRPLEPLGTFDVITVVSPAFDNDWGIKEWRFFLNDVGERLSPSGRLYLRLNHDRAPLLHDALTNGFAPPSKHKSDRREFIYDASRLRLTLEALSRSVQD
jgi:hypothetical protein